jgi:hypothetical protein
MTLFNRIAAWWNEFWRMPGQCPDCYEFCKEAVFAGDKVGLMCPNWHTWMENTRGEVVTDEQDDEGLQGGQGRRQKRLLIPRRGGRDAGPAA